ncbi:MAG: aspartate ammonia-lyase [Chloroflexi bacterium]|nr:aspartate ammonia-lyase [Chloroflexota bacterium]
MRTESDSLGPVQVPEEALWGAQTQRAVDNFPVSGLRQSAAYLVATALVKRAAAEVNVDLGMLDSTTGQAIVDAAVQIAEGSWHDQFVVDPFQAGAGTSHNMNANEVIANLANEALGGTRGVYKPVHPNDHVNMAQSTNDVIPTVLRVAAATETPNLVAAMGALVEVLNRKAEEFDRVLKPGRTHLQDAVPVRLGQEFAAYARAVELDRQRISRALEMVCRLGIGGTATGTGLNSHPEYHGRMVHRLAAVTGIPFTSAGDLFEPMQSAADMTDLSAALRTAAVTLTRIANDLRLLSSGPTTGFAEITLPAVQPGSSIMPGKVNPVMAEMLNMVCFHVMGNDLTIMAAAQAGQLELNVMTPIIAYNLLQSISILANGVRLFTERCVAGISANETRCRDLAEKSIGLATALNAYIGYRAAAQVAQEAMAREVPLRQVVLEHGYLSPEQLDRVLDAYAMTEPGIPGQNLE